MEEQTLKEKKSKLPIIIVIDDDEQVLHAIGRDLRRQYRKDYRILSVGSGEEALEVTKELKLKNETVALFLSDQRMPGMQGVDFLEAASELYPNAKRLLLTAYSDTNVAIQAINEVHLDYYLMKPWDPPEEKLYPVLDEQLEEWQSTYRPEFEGIKLVGYQWSPQSHEIKDFLAGNLIPYQWLDIELHDKARELLQLSGHGAAELPVLFFEDGSHLAKPDLVALAEKVGLNPTASEKTYDVIIIGAGPSGLAAAVYGASEGLRTLLIERHAPGGQAGTSSRIENYLGFPSGLSGAELTRRAVSQANRLGAEFLSPQEVKNIRLKGNYKVVELADGTELFARSVVITTGVSYRKLPAKGVEELTGAGVYYGAASTEATACRQKAVHIVGGGNSAGQAAMYLAKYARQVAILIRTEDLSESMSQYLIEQLNSTPNISILPHTNVVEVKGNGKLEAIVYENVRTGRQETLESNALFIFIGATPCADQFQLDLIKNEQGYIETGRDLQRYPAFRQRWKLDRDPLLLESSYPGIFAAGDVRAGALNRIASAVGEGAMAIKLVHEYLAEQ